MGLLWLSRNVTGEKRAEVGLLWLAKSENSSLGDRLRGLAWTSCHCPLLLRLQVSWGPLEFRR